MEKGSVVMVTERGGLQGIWEGMSPSSTPGRSPDSYSKLFLREKRADLYRGVQLRGQGFHSPRQTHWRLPWRDVVQDQKSVFWSLVSVDIPQAPTLLHELIRILNPKINSEAQLPGLSDPMTSAVDKAPVDLEGCQA